MYRFSKASLSRPMLVVPFAALALASCATPTGPVEVTRFNRADEAVRYGSGTYSVQLSEGQSSADPQYFTAVAGELRKLGYVESPTSQPASVKAFVMVTRENVKRESRGPVSVGVGGSTGSYGSGLGVGLGINLGGGGQQVLTTLSVRMVDVATNRVIWEGRAEQAAGKNSAASKPDIAANKLTSALFSGFPGKSGETIAVK